MWYLLFRLTLASGDVLEITTHDMDGRPFDLETCMVAGQAKLMSHMHKGNKDVGFLCSDKYPLTQSTTTHTESMWTPIKRPQ